MQVPYKIFILIFREAHIAQLAEHFHGKEKVACSIQAMGTKKPYLLLKIFKYHRKNDDEKDTEVI